MHDRMNRKSTLLATCGSAALSLATVALPANVAAQAFQATPGVVQGSVTIDRSVAGFDTIVVDGMDAVIDWRPTVDANGDALTFLPAGHTATFRNGNISPDFAVINRILPSTNGNVVQFDGAVISQLFQVSAPPVPGGHVLFYSPTGIVVGTSATFDVGSLVLTTLAPDIASFEAFATGTGSLALTGVTGDTSTIEIRTGAAFNAPEEGSYLVFASPSIDTSGTSVINGSIVFAAGQEMTLAHNSGLFDIVIRQGSASSTPISHNGVTGGPASTGAGDNHVIYGVVQGQAGPYTSLFSGNLGFDPAVSAGVENGVVVLSANYQVIGGEVQNDFTRFAPTSVSEADLAINGATITSDLIAHSSNFAQIGALDQTTEITGDVFLYGRVTSQIKADSPGTVDITGNVVVSANAVGVTTVNANNPSDLDASAGLALITAAPGGLVSITGDVSVLAVGVMGFDSGTQVAGNAAGGVAEVSAIGGTVEITGTLLVDASATAPLDTLTFNSGGFSDGGLVYLLSEEDGQLTVDGNVTVLANGTAYAIRGLDDGDPVGDGSGGILRVQAASGGQMDLGADLTLATDGSGAYSAVPGGTAGGGYGGSTTLRVDDSLSNITISGDLVASADAEGGFAESGTGGLADGGNVSVLLTSSGGLLVNTGLTTLTSVATGGDGDNGGAAESGSLILDLQASVFNTAGLVLTGAATGGTGDLVGSGLGGTILVELANAATLTSTGAFTATSSGTGANAVEGDGGSGTGGMVTFTLNNGTITMPAHAFSASSQGLGGSGYTGGEGTGGTVDIGVDANALLSSSTIVASSVGTGGNGSGNAGIGFGGAATGGTVSLDLTDNATVLSPGGVELLSSARAGSGTDDDGGLATAGSAILTVFDSGLTAFSGQLVIAADATGGDGSGSGSQGGDATGGLADLALTGESFVGAGSVQVTVDLAGGFGFGGEGGNVSGGLVNLTVSGPGTSMSVGNLGASRFGTSSLAGFTEGGDGIGGTATGGDVTVAVNDGGTLTFAPPGSPPFPAPEISSVARGGGSGGNGGAGGAALGGDVSLDLSTGELTSTSLAIGTLAIGGSGSGSISSVAGGNATGGEAAITAFSSSNLDSALQATTSAIGGNSTAGSAAGNAGGGLLTVLFDDSTIDLSGDSLFRISATGGNNTASGAGGNASAGGLTFALQGGSLVFDEPLSLLTIGGSARGGDGGSAGGNARTALVSVLFDSAPVSGLGLVTESVAQAGNNSAFDNAGDALSGTAVVRFGPGTAAIGSITIDTTATSFNTGSATGGLVQFVAQGIGASLTADSITLKADAVVPDTGSGTAGQFYVDALSTAAIVANSLDASAIDESSETAENHNSRLQALLGGQIRVLDDANLVSNGNIAFDSSSGGQILGGTTTADLTALFNVFSYNLLRVTGDNASLPALAADFLSLTSADIDIAAGAFLLAPDVSISALAGSDAAVLGGTTAGGGYRLTQAEFDRVETIFFSFGSFGDLLIRDLAIEGSLATGGVSSVALNASGSTTISGLIDYRSVAPTNNLFIGTGDTLQIILPAGGISMLDGNTSDPGLAGTLGIAARSIFAADSNLLGVIGSDPASTALGPLLLGSGTNTVDGSFIFADRVEIAAGDFILTQNTGVGTDLSGIIVGPGGLHIRKESDFGPDPLRVITYGARDNGDGTFTTNDDFFALVDFDTAPAANYTVDAELNECNIITGVCRTPPPPELENEVPLTSSDYAVPPAIVTSGDALAQVEADAAFGMEFPLRLNPPPVGDQGVVDDPVTSGGDSSTSGQPDSEEGE